MEMHGADSTAESYALIASELKRHFPTLARCRSTLEILGHPVYPSIEPTLKKVLTTADVGSSASAEAPLKDLYRVVAWNLERGIELEGQLEALNFHEYLRGADLFLLTETDVGMARSGNRGVAREFAKELELHYGFASCYLNLARVRASSTRLPARTDSVCKETPS
jgi:hypothetical protein